VARLPGVAAFFTSFLVCAVADAATSRLYPPQDDESGSLRLVQVVQLATREEILSLGSHVEHLLASGLKDSDLVDRSLAIGIVNCCNEKTSEGTSAWFYVPPEVPVQEGDIVVIRMGHKPTKKDPAGAINVLVEIRELANARESRCIWDPADERLWMRVLYCDWMPAEGWTLKTGMYKTWLKRPADDGNL
jgi:hypothetical protein